MSLDTAAQITDLLQIPCFVGANNVSRVRTHTLFAAQCPKWQLQVIGSAEVAVALTTA